MQAEYRGWLERQGYDFGTISTQLSRVARLEEFYGDLDQHFDQDRLQRVVETLIYSTEDQRRGLPNPSRIPFTGDIRTNIASYKSSARWYARFRDSNGESSTPDAPQRTVRERVTTPRGQSEIQLGARTLRDFKLDGRAALEAIISASQYRTIGQAVASLTLFTHPETVRQTEGRAIFPTIRNPRRVGQYDDHEGRRVLLVD